MASGMDIETGVGGIGLRGGVFCFSGSKATLGGYVTFSCEVSLVRGALPLCLLAEEAIEVGLDGEESLGENGCDITESRFRFDIVIRGD